MLYVKALNAIYGIIKAVLLFYNKFVGNITIIGFKLNPYYPYVSNKPINRNKMTVVWHIDYLKVIHKSRKIFTIMDKWMKKKYWRLFEYRSGRMNIYIDKNYEYLGTNLKFSEPGVVKITMIPYISDMLKDFTNNDDTVNTSTTP